MALALVAATACIVAAGGAPHRALAQEGTAGVAPPQPPPQTHTRDGRFTRFDLQNKTVTIEGYGTVATTDLGALEVDGKIREGRVKLQKWARFTFEGDRVIDAVWIEEPANVGSSTAQLSAKEQQHAETLRPCAAGEVVELNGQEVIYIKLDGTNVYYSPKGAKGSIVVALKDIRSLRRLGPGQTASGAEPEKPLIGVGEWCRINDEFYGICIRAVPGRGYYVELYPSGEKRAFELSEIQKIESAPAPTAAASTAGSAIRPSGPEGTVDVRVEIEGGPEFDLKSFDWVANEYKVKATVENGIEGKLVVGARLEVHWRGTGTILPRDKEEIIIRNKGGAAYVRSLVEKGDTTDVFTDQAVKYFLQREGEQVLIAERDDNATQSLVVRCPAVLFPGVKEELEVRPRLLGLRLDPNRPLTIRYDKDKGLIPFSDERALQYLIQAYEEGRQGQEVILDALSRSGGKALPFLLYKSFIETGKAADRVKAKVAAMGDVSAEYLVRLLRDKGYEKAFTWPLPNGSVESKVPTDPEAILLRAIEVLHLMGGGRAADQILQHTQSKNEVLRIEARRYFTERPHESIPLLYARLSGETLGPAKDMLREIARKDLAAIERFVAESLKSDRLQTALVGADPSLAAERAVDELVKLQGEGIRGAVARDPEVTQLRNALERVSTDRTTASDLRRQIAVELLKQVTSLAGAGPDADPRPQRLRLLQRAVLLDPTLKEARRGLAELFAEIANELRDSAALQAAPSDASRVLRKLKPGDVLDVVKPPEGAPEAGERWLYARTADKAVTGYVHASVVRPGKTVLAVEKARRPLEAASSYASLARSISPEKNANVDVAHAEALGALAQEVAEAGDWPSAYALFRSAAAVEPGRFRVAQLRAFLMARPSVPLSGIAAIILLVGALLWTPRPRRLLPPPPTGKAALATKNQAA